MAGDPSASRVESRFNSIHDPVVVAHEAIVFSMFRRAPVTNAVPDEFEDVHDLIYGLFGGPMHAGIGRIAAATEAPVSPMDGREQAGGL